MAFEALPARAFDFTKQVDEAYKKLIESAPADRDNGLGGKLFYAGELNEECRAMVTAANIAGAATLVATADRDAQKQAIRDGVADFLVNSLDEALRILKNELRKRGTVAVCVGVAAEAVEREMAERGVVADLTQADLPSAPIHQGPVDEESEQAEVELKAMQALVVWNVTSSPAQWLPALDAIALECLDAHGWQARRWLRLAPRYLGRLAQGLRLVSVDRAFAARFIERVRAGVQSGEIAVGVEVRSNYQGMEYAHRFTPQNAEGEG